MHEALAEGRRLLREIPAARGAKLQAKMAGRRPRRIGLEVRHAGDGTRLVVQAYLKPAEQLLPGEVRHGPLDEYAAEHAALYRSCPA